MIERLVKKELIHRLSSNPAVALLGPRQCGKTTLARALGGIYFDLEQPPDQLRLDLEWDRLIVGKDLIILDEAQNWPTIFNRLRGAIDADRSRTGRFLLLGSVSPALMIQVSESLAGRLSLLELTPFLLPELAANACDPLWLCGGFPDGGVLAANRYPQWQRDYLAILTQRDLPLWGLPAKPQTTDRLLRMLAALHGQTWNASQVGQSMSLDYKTVNSYLDYLVGAFLIRRLHPFQSNIRKRLVKSPKMYWRDTGLLHAFLNIPDTNALLHQPWVGASWEGFVIEQILGLLSTTTRHAEPFYFRTSDQHELDMVLDFGTQRWAIEIKLTSSPSTQDMDKLNQTADLISADQRFLISRTPLSTWAKNHASCNLEDFLTHLRSSTK